MTPIYSNPVKINTEPIIVDVLSTKKSFRRTHNPDGPDPVTGKFSFIIDIAADAKDIYLPISISSGKKPTGFVYQIEGTAQGFISTTDISCRGDKITQVTLGTIVYCKIPAGMTATFRIRIEMRGQIGKAYRSVIREIHYKFDPRDARYQESLQDLGTRMLKFS